MIGRRSSAFTLVELLVVTAILSLLAAILLPALHNAKEAGRMAKCLSNLKQLHVAAALYVDDHNGMVMDHGGDWGATACGSATNNCSNIVMPGARWAKWLDRLFPYTQYQIGVFECPSQRTKRGAQMPAPWPRREYVPGYLMNMHAIKWISGESIKLSDVKNPHHKVWFADSAWGFPGTQPVGADNNWDTWSPLSCRVQSAANQIRPISRRHRDGSNLLFFDGHAEWMKYTDAMPVNSTSPLYARHWDTDEDGNMNTP
jgi:prepilin-type processing-associated H-X9-DG protein/prepilin-type N-terminal cleavage/methylation domain-containing protein